MNNNLKFTLFFLILGLFMTSCEKEETTFSDLESEKRGTVISFPESTPGFFNVSNLSSENAFTFTNAELGEDVTSATLDISYNGSAPVVIESIVVDGSYSLSLERAAELTGVSTSSITEGDVFSMGINMSTASGDYRNGKVLNIPVSCLSELDGTYDYEATAVWCGEALTSGQVTFTQVSAGNYSIDDWSFGGYTSCYGGLAANWGTLTLGDVCNKLSVTGEDNYGDGWSYTVAGVSGSDLTISWSNDYGESGTAIITRPDGTDWPALFTE